MNKKTLIIIGTMKCGSTSLFKYLSIHPDICPCSIKEPNFFSDNKNWKKGTSYYDALWKCKKKEYYLEASVNYTKGIINPTIINRMKNINRTYKFLYIVRSPFERIESHYTNGIADKWEISKKTSDLVDAHAIDTTRYFYHVKPYIDNFGMENIMIIDFLDLKNDPTALLKNIFTFLNLSSEIPPSDFSQHNKGNSKRVYTNIGSYLFKLNSFISTPSFLSENTKDIIREAISSPVKRYKLSENQKIYIAKELKDDYKNFNRLFGTQVNTAKWFVFNKNEK